MVTPSSAAARLATRLSFLLAGFGMASWAPLVPFAKARLAIDDGAKGASPSIAASISWTSRGRRTSPAAPASPARRHGASPSGSWSISIGWPAEP